MQNAEFTSILRKVRIKLKDNDMKKIFFVTSISCAFLSFFFSAMVFAQTPTATPPLENEKEVVKIATNLIQIDITVKDKKGNQVTDIKPEEIEIYENGERKQLSNFSYVSSVCLLKFHRLDFKPKTSSVRNK